MAEHYFRKKKVIRNLEIWSQYLIIMLKTVHFQNHTVIISLHQNLKITIKYFLQSFSTFFYSTLSRLHSLNCFSRKISVKMLLQA